MGMCIVLVCVPHRGLSERFTCRKDAVKDKVRAHVSVLTKCLRMCVCVWVGVRFVECAPRS